jgi:hypothetical protein
VRAGLGQPHPGQALGGRTIEYVSHEFYRIADGLFAEEWICSDTATLQAQLTAGDTWATTTAG